VQDPGITSSNQEKRLRIVVLGGKLQGVEAVYLAKKAGWEVQLIDRQSSCPASGLCDAFIQADIKTANDLNRHLSAADLLIPAMENIETLASLKKDSPRIGIPVLFDFSAYALSSSKTASNRLFNQLRIPAPMSWPACGFPVVVKPSIGSGSRGVRVFHDASRLRAYTDRLTGQQVIQQFIHGPLFSIEVLGRSGKFFALQTTELEMDSLFDCKRVTAPTDLPRKHLAEFESIAVRLAESLSLQGLMDVEAVFHDNVFKILEIDARLPSQTPTAVWWSAGLNLLALLAHCFLSGKEMQKPVASSSRGVVYEHVRIRENMLEVAGEHIMSGAGVLYLQHDFFGADEALTNYRPHRQDWVATLINAGETRQAAWEKRNQVVSDIQRHFGLDKYDPTDHRAG
jgi:pyrrolysine biosynthesis protein PylC